MSKHTVNIRSELHRFLKQLSKETGISIERLVENALERYNASVVVECSGCRVPMVDSTAKFLSGEQKVYCMSCQRKL